MSTNNDAFKITLNLKSSDDIVGYTMYKDDDNSPYNGYWGIAKAYQQGIEAGTTKTYKNDNGVLKIETAKWIGGDQTPETRKDPKNWDTTNKIFEPAFIKFRKIKELIDQEIIKNRKVIKIEFMNQKYYLKPGQKIQFGTQEAPAVNIF